jgi:Ca-activated chloride channel family protein
MLVDNSASKFVFSFPLQDYLKADSATTTRIGMEILRVPRPPSAAATNTEAYAYVRDNDFLGTAENPLSTFSVAVDTASYANVRRFIQSGRLPPADAVRVEELVNYFPYHYASPAGDAPLAVSMEVADAPWAPAHRLVRIGLKGRELAIAARPPANLVFLIDVSGSMNEPAKLPLVKEAMRLLVGRLRPDDRVAIVVYAGASGLALPSTPVAKRREILAALDALTAGGPTNGAMGLQLAYDIAKANFVPGGVNRVILCTDGDFNVGVTSEGELTRLIQEKAKSGVSLTALGFGMGNYKDAMLKQLADQGNGNYGYIDTRREAEKLLVEQVNGTLMTVAKDVKLQVEFNPAQVASYRLIGYEDRLLKKEDFNDEAAEGGEIGAGHTVTALYEIVPTENPKSETRNPKSAALLTLKVRYREPAATVSLKREFPLTDAGARFADASADFKFAAAVAEFGMILRDSPHKGAGTLDQVVAWAEAGTDSDAGGDRGEFVGLVRQADVLMR